MGVPSEVLVGGKQPPSQNNKYELYPIMGGSEWVLAWERWAYQCWDEQVPGLGRHEPQEAVIAGDAVDESRLGLNGIELSTDCPPHSAHLLDEAPLTEHCSHKLNTSEPWIAICDASTENPVKLRISM